jgi:hypothetical protein
LTRRACPFGPVGPVLSDRPDNGYGHYEDELVKVNGQWLFTKRRIYNEGRAEWAHKGGNPAW